MNPRFNFDGVVYTVRESPDWTILVNRLVTKRFGVAAARNRQDSSVQECPFRYWTGMIDGQTCSIREVEESPEIVALVTAADDVQVKADALRAAQDARDDAMRAAFEGGATAAMIAAASGVSVARTYQIRERRR